MFQKIFKNIYTVIVLTVALFPRGLRAAIFDPETDGERDTEFGVGEIREALEPAGITGTEDIGDLILKYVNFSLPYLSLAAFVGFVYAGFLYVTAYGNEEQTQKAKKILIYSVLGLVLVILSYSIVRFFTEDLAAGIK